MTRSPDLPMSRFPGFTWPFSDQCCPCSSVVRFWFFPITRCPHHQITRFCSPPSQYPSQIGVGFSDIIPSHPRLAWGWRPWVSIGVGTPTPIPHVHPIPPKVTQYHPRLRKSAEGRKPEMMPGTYIALAFPITRSPDRQITRFPQPLSHRLMGRSPKTRTPGSKAGCYPHGTIAKLLLFVKIVVSA